MPELPEVETVRAGLSAFITDQQVSSVEVLHPRSIRRHQLGSADFVARLRGRTFAEPQRRGKYLWLPLDDGFALVAHLGMSGQFQIASDELAAKRRDERHLRVRITFSNGQQLLFNDQRTFGGLFLDQVSVSGLPDSIAHIARDPFDPAYNVEATATRLRARQQDVKRALLDQTLVSGVGNIYADEALWHAKLHFARQTSALTKTQAIRVLTAAQEVMADALAQGGTSFDEMYVNVNGESGYFERSLQVYGREGEPCSRCGRAIRRTPFANRSSFFCPNCQRRQRSRRGPRALVQGS